MPLQATSGAASYDAFGGGVPVVPAYIEEVFSTFLYSGTGASQTITNNIDLSTKGGLVWLKARNDTRNNWLYDTVRGKEYGLRSDLDFAQNYSTNSITAFNNNGFSIGDSGNINSSGNTLVSWSWAKAPKFFDVVTYTGNDVGGRTVSHNLGSAPGCMIIKRTDVDGYFWVVYHRGANGGVDPEQYYIKLNATDTLSGPNSSVWNNTAPTSTNFTLGTASAVNLSGATYIAYLFAHNAGGFGLTGTDNVISCGSFTGNTTVNLGYEPQWIMLKRVDNIGSWDMHDVMRGWPVSGDAARLRANLSDAEGQTSQIYPNATGFSTLIGSGDYIYIAIRRGPMKVPTDATKVFYPQAISQADNIDSTGVPFPPDLVNTFSRNGTGRSSTELFQFVDRLRGLGTPNNTFTASAPRLVSSDTSAENIGSSYVQLKADSQNITRGSGWNSASYGNWIDYFWRRAPSFFDVVCYTGTGSARTVTHNLAAVPEMMIVKGRAGTRGWRVYYGVNTKAAELNSTGSADTNSVFWNNTSPTASVFTVGTDSDVNSSAVNYVAYLFATCAGVSKVTTFTGNGSSQTINCGFTGGARFVLIKRVDSTGNWVTFDTARGISSGNDPALYLNSTAAEVTGVDAIDPDSTGFIVNQESTFNLNVSSATYLVLAIA